MQLFETYTSRLACVKQDRNTPCSHHCSQTLEEAHRVDDENARFARFLARLGIPLKLNAVDHVASQSLVARGVAVFHTNSKPAVGA